MNLTLNKVVQPRGAGRNLNDFRNGTNTKRNFQKNRQPSDMPNGLCLNLKKTKYMIFSRARNLELLSTLTLANLPIERLTESKFIGVIVDENLTWSRHIKTIQTKMARYIGLMYKLKSQLPLKVRIQIFHSFVQSHINYYSLVWGFSTKVNIDSLFRTQKKRYTSTYTRFHLL